jgi:hypothetical protein
MMESDLRRALDSDELEVRLQPQFACETLEVTGFEALARWRHPIRGDLSPAVFIPIAERSGLINPLGLMGDRAKPARPPPVASRHRSRSISRHPAALRNHPGGYSRHSAPHPVSGASAGTRGDRKRAAGRGSADPGNAAQIAIDGHQGHARRFRHGILQPELFRRFPFDKIKIDKSFIQGQGTDRGTRVILEAMIRMCTDLGFDVVAEGVETELQLQANLRQLGCREIQGFLLGEPLRPDVVEAFLTRHALRRASRRARSVEHTAS